MKKQKLGLLMSKALYKIKPHKYLSKYNNMAKIVSQFYSCAFDSCVNEMISGGNLP
jgi:uncharacterized protein YpuA (DUF1002 family)